MRSEGLGVLTFLTVEIPSTPIPGPPQSQIPTLTLTLEQHGFEFPGLTVNNPHITGPAQFKPTLFKSQPQLWADGKNHLIFLRLISTKTFYTRDYFIFST